MTLKNTFDTIFEDDYIIVVNKPAGWLSVPDRYDSQKPSVYGTLKLKYPNLLVVHRIDKYTSGLLIFAKEPNTHRALNQMFEDHEVQKVYHAIVQGVPLDLEGTIDLPIAKDPSHDGQMKIHPKGKKSISLYKVLEAYKEFSLLEFQIKTGRTHQIRVHAQAINHALAVDKVYGGKESLTILDIKHGKKLNRSLWEEERPLINRQTLHAQSLRFIHPITKEEITLEAAYPKDFNAAINQLRKWQGRA